MEGVPHNKRECYFPSDNSANAGQLPLILLGVNRYLKSCYRLSVYSLQIGFLNYAVILDQRESVRIKVINY